MSHISEFYRLNINLINTYATEFIIKTDLGFDLQYFIIKC
jgi:hypothetical protein